MIDEGAGIIAIFADFPINPRISLCSAAVPYISRFRLQVNGIKWKSRVTITIMEEVYNLCNNLFLFHNALYLLFVIAKIATISIFPKIILLSLIKIAGCRLKISGRYLKISVRYLKIAG